MINPIILLKCSASVQTKISNGDRWKKRQSSISSSNNAIGIVYDVMGIYHGSLKFGPYNCCFRILSIHILAARTVYKVAAKIIWFVADSHFEALVIPVRFRFLRFLCRSPLNIWTGKFYFSTTTDVLEQRSVNCWSWLLQLLKIIHDA